MINHSLPLIPEKKLTKNGKNIAFMGALKKGKGLQVLINQWPKIIKKNPDANLYVIGGTDLYSKKRKALDNQFLEKLKYKINKYPLKYSNIHFLGTLNYLDRSEVLEKIDIGVANPTGKTETFCLSALEFIRNGIPVVTVNDYSLPDVVNNKKTGILYHFKYNLHRKINYILKDEGYLLQLKKQCQDDKTFEIQSVLKDWLNLFTILETHNTFPSYSISIKNYRLKKFYSILVEFINSIGIFRLPNIFFLIERIVRVKRFIKFALKK